jgi:YtkA-like
MRTIFLAAAAPLFLLPTVCGAQASQATLDCKSASKDLVYDCNLRLTRAGEPIKDVEVSVSADMPSMPMAHNVRPVKAQPASTPGEFVVRLTLEMHGDWAVKVRLSGAVKDVLVVQYEFDDKGARPAKR